jgi:hypothetical protein
METQRTVRDTQGMVSGMTPTLAPGEFVFCTTIDEQLAVRGSMVALAWFREAEGVSLILGCDDAAALGFDCGVPMRRIVLNVFSSLEGVGLTAAVASALSRAGIACNVVAAYHHDHVFVPSDNAGPAMEILKALQAAASAT